METRHNVFTKYFDHALILLINKGKYGDDCMDQAEIYNIIQELYFLAKNIDSYLGYTWLPSIIGLSGGDPP